MTSILLTTNRMRAHFEAAIAAVMEARATPLPRRVQLTYMCGEDLGLTLKPDDHLLRLICPKIYNRYADKGTLAQIMEKTGPAGLLPVTVFSTQDAQAHPDIDLWFSKNRFGTAGKAMECVSAAQLGDYTLPQHHILQGAVEDIALYEGRKFTSRFYMLVWNGGLWFYEDGFNIIHGVPYEPGSTDYTVQIRHEGYQKPDSPVKMQMFSDYADAPRYWPAMREAGRAMIPALGELLAASSRSEYILLGIDAIPKLGGPSKSDSVQILEVNAIPNFMHTAHINETLNVPFLTAAIEVMLGGKAAGLERLA